MLYKAYIQISNVKATSCCLNSKMKVILSNTYSSRSKSYRCEEKMTKF